MSDYTRKQRQQRRRAALNEAARRLGYASWARLETAVINGQVTLTAARTASPEGTNQTTLNVD